MRTATNTKALAAFLSHEYGDGATEQAERIRTIWKASREEIQAGEIEPELFAEYKRHHYTFRASYFRFWAINQIAKGYGVEGLPRKDGGYVEYVNMGDTYAETILFHNGRLFLGCWGDLVESGLIADRNHY